MQKIKKIENKNKARKSVRKELKTKSNKNLKTKKNKNNLKMKKKLRK